MPHNVCVLFRHRVHTPVVPHNTHLINSWSFMCLLRVLCVALYTIVRSKSFCLVIVAVAVVLEMRMGSSNPEHQPIVFAVNSLTLDHCKNLQIQPERPRAIKTICKQINCLQISHFGAIFNLFVICRLALGGFWLAVYALDVPGMRFDMYILHKQRGQSSVKTLLLSIFFAVGTCCLARLLVVFDVAVHDTQVLCRIGIT